MSGWFDHDLSGLGDAIGGFVDGEHLPEDASFWFQLDSLLDPVRRYGPAAAMAAGLLEDTRSPLLGPLTDAAMASYGTAGAFAALPAPGLSASQGRSIRLANDNVGAWKPYLERAADSTRAGAAGLPTVDLARYLNPYMRSVVDPAAQAVKRSAATRRSTLESKAGMRSAWGGPAPRLERSMLDSSEAKITGDLYKTGTAEAHDYATNTASKDLTRLGDVGRVYSDMGKAVGAFGSMDASSLAKAGELERQPYEDERTRLHDSSRLYAGLVHGDKGDGWSKVLGVTAPTSKLTQGVGALGTLSSLAKNRGAF